MNMHRWLLVCALLVAALLLACSGDDNSAEPDTTQTPEPQPTATPTPRDLIEASARAVAGLESFHFTLDHENGGSPLPLDMELDSAEGDIVVPDSLQAEIDASVRGLTISVDVISIADQTWITNPFSGQWQDLPGATVQDIADPAGLVEAVVSSISNVEVTGEEKVDSVDTYVISGQIESGALQASLPFAEPGHDVQVEVWIGIDDSLPRRARLTGPITDDESDDIVRLIELSRFNSDVEITAPE